MCGQGSSGFIYVGGLIPGILVASVLSDRRGRKPILLAEAIAAIIGSIFLGLGFDLFWLLCVGRVFASIGVGALVQILGAVARSSSRPW